MGQFVVVGTAGQTSSQYAMPVVLVDKDNADFYNASLTGGTGGTAMVDDAAFSPGTTEITPVGGTYIAARDSVNDNDGGAFAMTAKRALYTSIETPAGDTAMDDTNDAVRVNVVLGTVTTVSTVTNLSQLGGQAIAMNTGTRSAGTQRVTIATDDIVPASQSGTWTVQPGNTANTTPWLVTGTGGTFPVSQGTASSLKGQFIMMDSGGTNLGHVNADGGFQTTQLPTGKTDFTTGVTASVTATGTITIWAAASGNKAVKEVYIGANGFGGAAKATFKRNSVSIGDIYLSSVNFMSKDKLDFDTTDLTVDVVTDNAAALPVYVTVKYYQ